jgi:hypothetical protein
VSFFHEIANNERLAGVLVGTLGYSGIASSLVWFAAGNQSLKNGHPNSALAWDCGAVFTILVGIGWMIKEAEWLGVVVAVDCPWHRNSRQYCGTKKPPTARIDFQEAFGIESNNHLPIRDEARSEDRRGILRFAQDDGKYGDVRGKDAGVKAALQAQLRAKRWHKSQCYMKASGGEPAGSRRYQALEARAQVV